MCLATMVVEYSIYMDGVMREMKGKVGEVGVKFTLREESEC